MCSLWALRSTAAAWSLIQVPLPCLQSTEVSLIISAGVSLGIPGTACVGSNTSLLTSISLLSWFSEDLSKIFSSLWVIVPSSTLFLLHWQSLQLSSPSPPPSNISSPPSPFFLPAFNAHSNSPLCLCLPLPIVSLPGNFSFTLSSSIAPCYTAANTPSCRLHPPETRTFLPLNLCPYIPTSSFLIWLSLLDFPTSVSPVLNSSQSILVISSFLLSWIFLHHISLTVYTLKDFI